MNEKKTCYVKKEKQCRIGRIFVREEFFMELHLRRYSEHLTERERERERGKKTNKATGRRDETMNEINQTNQRQVEINNKGREMKEDERRREMRN